jgi:hypothetical protein
MPGQPLARIYGDFEEINGGAASFLLTLSIDRLTR